MTLWVLIIINIVVTKFNKFQTSILKSNGFSGRIIISIYRRVFFFNRFPMNILHSHNTRTIHYIILYRTCDREIFREYIKKKIVPRFNSMANRECRIIYKLFHILIQTTHIIVWIYYSRRVSLITHMPTTYVIYKCA